VDGEQRRGLSGVERQALPAQAEEVGDPVRDDAAVRAGERVRAERVRAQPVV
jgi:hypothetical protein